jgi:hypothetical protein
MKDLLCHVTVHTGGAVVEHRMKPSLYIFICLLCFACQSSKKSVAQSPHTYSDIDTTAFGESLIAETNEEYMQLGAQIRFVTTSGEEVIPFGKYRSLQTDTLKTFTSVILKDEEANRWVYIDRNENVLFDIYTFDNGPDYISEGLFRVIRNEKIGYANEKGQIVIPCIYACAFPFKDGQAKVSFKCEPSKYDEHGCHHLPPTSDKWIYIDKSGK